MAHSSESAQPRELGEIRNHLKWLNEERRKATQRMADLEQRLAQQGRDLAERDQRILVLEQRLAGYSAHLDELMSRESTTSETEQRLHELESHVSSMNSQLARLPDPEQERVRAEASAQSLQSLSQQLATTQEEIGNQSGKLEERIQALAVDSQNDFNALAGRFQEHIDDVDKAQLATIDRLAQLEQSLGKIGNVQDVMPVLDRLERELELREAEGVRLSALIGTQKDNFAPLAERLEEIGESSALVQQRLEESDRLLQELKTTIREVNESLRPSLDDAHNRITPLVERVSSQTNNILKAEAGIQAITEDQSELREKLAFLSEDFRRMESDIAGQLEAWQSNLDENKETVEQFTQQWLMLNNQYKGARMAVQNFAHWQKQLEQQKRETTEFLRLESNRTQSRWDSFMIETQERLKTLELDLAQKWQALELENEQKWSNSRRNEQLWRDELSAVGELIKKVQQDNRNLIWRIQNAQADAIKKWPRMLLEEVEKAVELNPERRLSLTTSTPPGDMSVVDAIEQGLITIDYDDEATSET